MRRDDDAKEQRARRRRRFSIDQSLQHQHRSRRPSANVRVRREESAERAASRARTNHGFRSRERAGEGTEYNDIFAFVLDFKSDLSSLFFSRERYFFQTFALLLLLLLSLARDDDRRGRHVTLAMKSIRSPSSSLSLARLKTNNVTKQKKALERVLGEIDSTFGKGSIMKLGSAGQAKVATFPSGAMTLDMALGGGLPRGRIVEIYGPESSGKTTLAMHAMAEMQKLGGTVALIDAEHAFDPDYAKRLGLNVDDLVVCQPETGEMALEVVDTLVRSAAVDLICVDSVAALVPRSEIEGEIGMVQVGAHARLMSQALRKINVNAAKANTTILFLNQLRSKVGVIYGNPEVTTGGNALKYYSSVRLDIRRKEVIKGKAGEDDLGTRVKVKVAKNKVAPPYKVAEFDMLFGRGISSEGCVFDVAEATGVIEKKGSWYSFKGEQLGQGREKSLLAAKEKEGLYEEIVRLTREAIAAKMGSMTGEQMSSSEGSMDEDDEDMFEEEEDEEATSNVAAR